MASGERRSYDPKLAALLPANFHEGARAARNLRVSVDRTVHLFPLDGAKLDAPDDEGLERLDAFRVRFADLQDVTPFPRGARECLVAPLSGAPTAPQLDLMHRETRLWRQTRLAAS